MSSPVWLEMTDAQRVCFLELLNEARWKATVRQTPSGPVRRGQMVLSVRRASDISPTGKSKKVVETVLARLLRAGTVSVEDRGHFGRLITFLNYDRYQSFATLSGDSRGDRGGDSTGDSAGDDPVTKGTKGTKRLPSAAPLDPPTGTLPLAPEPVLSLALAEPPPVNGHRKRAAETEALVADLAAIYAEVRGEAMVKPRGSDYGDLAAVRAALADDAELRRRWRLFCADTYWPIKSLNRFRSAFQHPKFARPAATDPAPNARKPLPIPRF